MQANPKAQQLLCRLLENGTIKKSTEPLTVYDDPRYSAVFSKFNFEKYRKKFRTVQNAKFNNMLGKGKCLRGYGD